MLHTRGRRERAGNTLALVLPAALIPLTLFAGQANALPEFSRIYNVNCQTCHSIPPRLNATGLAFQANHFNFTDEMPIRRQTGLKAVPLSAIVTFSHLEERTQHESSTDFRALEIYSSDGFNLGGNRRGGWFV